jgi:hypothetical protein
MHMMLNKRLLVIAFFLTPVLIFSHECVHYFLFCLYGLKPFFAGMSMTELVGFDYTFSGIKTAVEFYGQDANAVVVATIAGPLFTLFCSLAFYALYRRTKRPIFWSGAFNPLSVRMLGLTVLLPKILSGNQPTDEAVAAFFLNVPIGIFAIGSLVLGYALLIVEIRLLEKKDRFAYSFSTLVGGTIGYAAIEFLFNTLILKL